MIVVLYKWSIEQELFLGAFGVTISICVENSSTRLRMPPSRAWSNSQRCDRLRLHEIMKDFHNTLIDRSYSFIIIFFFMRYKLLTNVDK